jgi:hypothetical protein
MSFSFRKTDAAQAASLAFIADLLDPPRST